MEQFRDWFIEYCDETWKEVPRGLKNQTYLFIMFDCGCYEPFETKYHEKLMTLPLVTLNKMNEWALRQMGFSEPRITEPLDIGIQCLNYRIDFPHLHFYTKDEITNTIIDRIIRSFVWRFQWFIEKEKSHRLYAYLSAKNKKAKLECLKRIFEWSYLSSQNPL